MRTRVSMLMMPIVMKEQPWNVNRGFFPAVRPVPAALVLRVHAVLSAITTTPGQAK